MMRQFTNCTDSETEHEKEGLNLLKYLNDLVVTRLDKSIISDDQMNDISNRAEMIKSIIFDLILPEGVDLELMAKTSSYRKKL